MVAVIAKVVVGACELFWLAWLIETVRLGRDWSRRHRKAYKRRKFIPEKHKHAAIWTYKCLLLTLASATLAHVAVRREVGMQVIDTAFLIHLPAALLLVAIMPVQMFWLNGMKHARVHGVLGPLTIALSGVVAVTGSLLLGGLG